MPVTRLIEGIGFYIRIQWYDDNDKLVKAVIPIVFREMDTLHLYMEHHGNFPGLPNDRDIFIQFCATLVRS
jgi:hypothetical protein